jgi:hypothetical protein
MKKFWGILALTVLIQGLASAKDVKPLVTAPFGANIKVLNGNCDVVVEKQKNLDEYQKDGLDQPLNIICDVKAKDVGEVPITGIGVLFETLGGDGSFFIGGPIVSLSGNPCRDDNKGFSLGEQTAIPDTTILKAIHFHVLFVERADGSVVIEPRKTFPVDPLQTYNGWKAQQRGVVEGTSPSSR